MSTSQSPQDRLVRQCQEGDLAAFAALFRQQEAQVYRLALAILQNEQDAEDAVQDVFLRIFEQIKTYEGRSSFKTWLTTIVVNLCRDRLRRRKVRRVLSLEWLRGKAGPDDVVEEVSRRQQSQQLWSLVQSLDENHRLPVILHYHQRLTCDEVAQVLGLRLTTVYARLHTARGRLRAMLPAQPAAAHNKPA